MASWIPALRRTGVEISTDPAVCDAHGGDAWMAVARPEAVVHARNTGEVSRVLRLANRMRVPVTVRGAGRGYVGGCVPVKGGLVLSMMRMNRIREVSAADFVAVVQPGVVTAVLQERAERKGLFYPPDPASRDTCSIGGNIAANAGGPRCLKYGVTRQYVLGLEVVTANGSVLRCGGRTHKNKTGFDLVGLFTGSEGMLGVVTEATLRLLPLPPARATVAATFATGAAAAAAVRAVLGAGFLPCALEVADAYTLQCAREHLGAKRVPAGRAFLLVELDGQPETVRAEALAVSRIVRACRAVSLRVAPDAESGEKLWALRREFSPALRVRGLDKLNEDIVVPRGRLVDLFRFAERLRREHGFPVACFGHAGDGNIHVNVMCDLSAPGVRRRVDTVLEALFRQVLEWGGAVTGEHGVGLAKRRWFGGAVGRPVLEAHHAIKRALDPHGVLNPGKFL